MARTARQWIGCSGGARHVSTLSGAVHAVENAHHTFDRRGRDSRSAAPANRLGGGTRLAFARWLGALRYFILLAISTLHGDRVDVPGRLRARGHSHAAGW